MTDTRQGARPVIDVNFGARRPHPLSRNDIKYEPNEDFTNREIEKVISVNITNDGDRIFLISWKGCSKASWMPEEQLYLISNFNQEFLKNFASSASSSIPQIARKSTTPRIMKKASIPSSRNIQSTSNPTIKINIVKQTSSPSSPLERVVKRLKINAKNMEMSTPENPVGRNISTLENGTSVSRNIDMVISKSKTTSIPSENSSNSINLSSIGLETTPGISRTIKTEPEETSEFPGISETSTPTLSTNDSLRFLADLAASAPYEVEPETSEATTTSTVTSGALVVVTTVSTTSKMAEARQLDIIRQAVRMHIKQEEGEEASGSQISDFTPNIKQEPQEPISSGSSGPMIAIGTDIWHNESSKAEEYLRVVFNTKIKKGFIRLGEFVVEDFSKLENWIKVYQNYEMLEKAIFGEEKNQNLFTQMNRSNAKITGNLRKFAESIEGFVELETNVKNYMLRNSICQILLLRLVCLRYKTTLLAPQQITLYLYQLLSVYGHEAGALITDVEFQTSSLWLFHEPIIKMIEQLRDTGLKELDFAVYAGLMVVQASDSLPVHIRDRSKHQLEKIGTKLSQSLGQMLFPLLEVNYIMDSFPQQLLKIVGRPSTSLNLHHEPLSHFHAPPTLTQPQVVRRIVNIDHDYAINSGNRMTSPTVGGQSGPARYRIRMPTLISKARLPDPKHPLNNMTVKSFLKITNLPQGRPVMQKRVLDMQKNFVAKKINPPPHLAIPLTSKSMSSSSSSSNDSPQPSTSQQSHKPVNQVLLDKIRAEITKKAENKALKAKDEEMERFVIIDSETNTPVLSDDEEISEFSVPRKRMKANLNFENIGMDSIICVDLDHKHIRTMEIGLKLNWRFLIPNATDEEPERIFMKVAYSERSNSDVVFWIITKEGKVYSNIWNVNHFNNAGDAKNRQVCHYECKNCKKNKKNNTFRLIIWNGKSKITVETTEKSQDHLDDCGSVFPPVSEHKSKKPKDKPEHLVEILYSDCVRRVCERIRNGEINQINIAEQHLANLCAKMLQTLETSPELGFDEKFVGYFRDRVTAIIETYATNPKKRFTREQSFGRRIIEVKSNAFWCHLLYGSIENYEEILSQNIHPRSIAYEVSKKLPISLFSSRDGETEKPDIDIEKNNKVKLAIEEFKLPREKFIEDLKSCVRKYEKYIKEIRVTKRSHLFEVPNWYFENLKEDSKNELSVRRKLRFFLSLEPLEPLEEGEEEVNNEES